MDKFNFKLFALFRGLPLLMFTMGLFAVNTFTDKMIHIKTVDIIDVMILSMGIVIGLSSILLITLPIVPTTNNLRKYPHQKISVIIYQY